MGVDQAMKCCGTCKYHRCDRDTKDWYCDNLDSEYYADYTGYEDCPSCQDWEARKATLGGSLEKTLKNRERAFRNYRNVTP